MTNDNDHFTIKIRRPHMPDVDLNVGSWFAKAAARTVIGARVLADQARKAKTAIQDEIKKQEAK